MRWLLLGTLMMAAGCGTSERWVQTEGSAARSEPGPPPAAGPESPESEPEPEPPASVPEPEPPEPPEPPESQPEPEGAGSGTATLTTARAPWTVEATLATAAFDVPEAPSVVVHAPPGFDPSRPIRLVVFVHGWSGCARQLVHQGRVRCGRRELEGWGLGARFDAARTDALFVVPQLAFLRRDGSPGRFSERGRFRAFLEELLVELTPRLGPRGLSRVESISLLAHSAGYETTLAILARGDVDPWVRHVVLFDALYRGHGPFAEWARGGEERRLVSLHTGQGRTASQSRLLAGRLRAELGDALSNMQGGDLASRVREHRVVIAATDAPHSRVPAEHLPELLGALGLSMRSTLEP